MSLIPNANPIKSTIVAWTRALTEAASTFPSTIDDLLIGATRSLFRNPSLLSHAIDMPLKTETKRTITETIPVATKEK